MLLRSPYATAQQRHRMCRGRDLKIARFMEISNNFLVCLKIGYQISRRHEDWSDAMCIPKRQYAINARTLYMYKKPFHMILVTSSST
jgi:hypothetical protein